MGEGVGPKDLGGRVEVKSSGGPPQSHTQPTSQRQIPPSSLHLFLCQGEEGGSQRIERG